MVVIPTFERDLCKLKYTAKSISVHDPNKYLGDVLIVWVSTQSSDAYKEQIDEIKSLIAETRKVDFMDFTWQVNNAHVGGWFAQQVLKLKIASLVTADFYIVLDSKNTLIRDVEADTFVTPCNQAKIFGTNRFDQIPEPHAGWYKTSARMLGVAPPNEGYWPASITPMTLHKQTVLDMLASIGEGNSPYGLCAGKLCGMLDGGATEFTMYLTFVHSKGDSFKCIHAVEQLDWRHMISSGLWRGVGEQKVKQAEYNVETCRNVALHYQIPLVFGAQSRSFDGMSYEQRSQAVGNLTKIYQDAKLTGLGHDSGDDLVKCVA